MPNNKETPDNKETRLIAKNNFFSSKQAQISSPAPVHHAIQTNTALARFFLPMMGIIALYSKAVEAYHQTGENPYFLYTNFLAKNTTYMIGFEERSYGFATILNKLASGVCNGTLQNPVPDLPFNLVQNWQGAVELFRQVNDSAQPAIENCLKGVITPLAEVNELTEEFLAITVTSIAMFSILFLAVCFAYYCQRASRCSQRAQDQAASSSSSESERESLLTNNGAPTQHTYTTNANDVYIQIPSESTSPRMGRGGG